MSWKNLASVAVIALLASPAWAAPTLRLENIGLNGAGNWLWELRASPDTSLFQTSCGTCTPPNTLGGSLALELGLRASLGDILSVTANPSTIPNAATGSASAPVEFENPGNKIFGWETDTVLTFGSFPVGIQVGTGADSNEAFVAVGTTFFSGANPTNGYLIATVETTGPETSQAVSGLITTSLQLLGRYDGSGGLVTLGTDGNAAVAQSTSTTTSLLYDGYSGSATRVVRNGDANLSNTTDFQDYQVLLDNYNGSPRIWSTADFTGEGTADFQDYQVILDNYDQGGGSNTPLVASDAGAGAGAGATVPEPASLALAALALFAGVLFVRRK